MKKSVKILSFILAIIMVVLPLTSCKGSKKTDVYSLGGVSITDDLYRYWLSYYKSYYAKYFSDIKDTPEGWKTEVTEGVTAEEYVMDMVDKRMKLYIAAMKLFKDYDLELSVAAELEIAQNIEEQIEYYGGRAALGNALKNSCNITIEGLEQVYSIEKMVQQLSAYLYGENGVTPVTDEQIDAYYKENFSRVKYLYFDKVNKYVYNEDGSIKTSSSGAYLTEELTQDEKKELEKTAKAAYEQALKESDFNKLIKLYNTPDMDYTKSCPDGYYISSGSYTSSYVYTLVSKGMKMKPGEIEFAEDEYAYYVIAKYDLIEKAYKTDESGQLDYIDKYTAEDLFSKLLEKEAEGVTVNTDYISKVKLVDIGKNINV